MEDTSGFYKVDQDGLFLRALKWVRSPTVWLKREEYDQHTYPQDGWYWFASEEDAVTFFGLEAGRRPDNI